MIALFLSLLATIFSMAACERDPEGVTMIPECSRREKVTPRVNG